MKKEDFFKLYIDHGDKASEFLDKAILTISTSILGLITLSNIQDKVNNNYLFNLGIVFIFMTFTLVLLSYVIGIHNSQLGISYFEKGSNKKWINKKITRNNNIINIFRYGYVLLTLLGLLFLIISILHYG